MNDGRTASRPLAAPTAEGKRPERGHGLRPQRAKAGLCALSVSCGLASLLVVLSPARAEPTAPPPAKTQAPPEPNPERPEYRARALPKDTFNPSEQVQEDQPVPFPEDVRARDPDTRRGQREPA